MTNRKAPHTRDGTRKGGAMADTKYLQKRGNCWFIRVPRPPSAWGMAGEFACTLRTPELKTAQQLRDKYLIPLLAETAAGDMVAAIARLAAANDEAIANRLAELRGDLSGLESRLTLREAGSRFLDYLRSSAAYAPASLRKYAASIDAACRLIGEEVRPDTLTKADAARFRDALLALPVGWQRSDKPPLAAAAGKRRLSARSVDRCLTDLRRMFRRLIDEGRLLNAGDWHGADGTAKHGHTFLKHYNRRCKKVAPDLSFHCWRVYANDAMATAGVDITDRERLLGHVSSRTQAAYTPENLRRLKAAVDSIP